MNEIEARIRQLRKELDEHNYNYYVLNAPTIDDREFDRLMAELQRLEEENPQYADPHSPTCRGRQRSQSGIYPGGTPLSDAFAGKHLYPG